MSNISKNSLCICNSEKKYKVCCGSEDFGNYFFKKLKIVIDYNISLAENIVKQDIAKRRTIVKKIRENRISLYQMINKKISGLVDYINLFDKIYILGGISSVFHGNLHSNQSDNMASEAALEYCQNICMTSTNSGTKMPNHHTIIRIHKLLSTIRELYDLYISCEFDNEKHTIIEMEFRKKIIAESLFIRGQGYSVHITDLFKKMFKEHNEFLEKKYGFEASSIIETFHEIEKDFCLKFIRPNGILTPIQQFHLENWIKTKLKRNTYQITAAEYKEFMNEYPHYELNDFKNYNKLYTINFNTLSEKQKKVIDALSINFGDNEKFILKEIKDSHYFPLNDSEVYLKPIIKYNNSFYVFSHHIWERNLFGIAINLIKKDINYFDKNFIGNKVEKSKDNFIERECLELFKKMLPEVVFYPNAKYNYPELEDSLKCKKESNGNYEIDLIGESEKAIYLIEVKAGLVSNSTKRGGIKSFINDFSNIIGEAVCQSYRAYQYLLNKPNASFISNKKEITPNTSKKIFRICISFSYIGKIISALSKLKDLEIIGNRIDFAWVLNIFDLYVFSDLIDSEDSFIEYLEKRIKLYNDSRFRELDEVSVLGWYLDNGMQIDEKIKNSFKIELNPHYTEEISNYYQMGGAKPKKKK